MRASQGLSIKALNQHSCHQVQLQSGPEQTPGVRVVAVTQQIDLSGTVGHMVASVMFGLAEIELDYRREHQAAGIAVARRKGIYKGRQRGTTKAQPARAQELQANGLTVPEIANAMAVSKRTVFRYLNETK